MPGSLEDALDTLDRDCAFLLMGDVFAEELLRTYVDYKRSKEMLQIPKLVSEEAFILHCRSPFYLCLEHVDNLGAYSIPSGDRPSHPICLPQQIALALNVPADGSG